MATPTPTPSLDAEPIAIGDGPLGVLLLHGLTGTPYEVRVFADALADRGFAVRGPRLRGHEDLAALERTTWRDWYEDAHAAFEQLHDGGRRRVAVAGFSMGSLLALRLAALRPREVPALVAASVPLALPTWQGRAISILGGLRRNRWLGPLVRPMPKRDGPDIRIEAERTHAPGLDAFPFPTLQQFVALQQEVDSLLELVRAPLLLLHGRYDHIAPPELSARVAQRVASADVMRIVLENSFHILGLDLDRARACDEIEAFVVRHLGEPTRPPSARADSR